MNNQRQINEVASLQNSSIVMSRPTEELYYSSAELTHTSSELYVYDNYQQSMNNVTFGSSSSFLISQSIQGFSNMCLQMIFSPPGVGVSLASPLAWSAIDRVQVTVAGSVVYQIPGRSMMLQTLRNCETQEKFNQIMSLANGGFSLNTPIVGPVTGNIECNIPLDILFSSVCASNQRKPLNIDLSNGPFQLEIYLQNASYFSTGGYAATSLVSGLLYAQEAFFADKSKSIRNFLLSHPEEQYMSPEIFIQQINLGQYTVSNSINAPSAFNISNFRKSKVLALMLSVVAVTDDNSLNHFLLQDLISLRADKDGQIFYLTQNSGHRMKQLFDTMCPFVYSCAGHINAPGFIPTGCVDAWYMNGSIAKSIVVNNGTSFLGSTINLSFAIAAEAPTLCNVYLTVLYSGDIQFNNGAGQFIY